MRYLSWRYDFASRCSQVKRLVGVGAQPRPAALTAATCGAGDGSPLVPSSHRRRHRGCRHLPLLPDTWITTTGAGPCCARADTNADVLCQPPSGIARRLAVKRFALGPAGRLFGDGGAEHPLGGGEVGHWARRGWDGERAVLLQGTVAGGVVRDPVLPAAPHDPAPGATDGA